MSYTPYQRFISETAITTPLSSITFTLNEQALNSGFVEIRCRHLRTDINTPPPTIKMSNVYVFFNGDTTGANYHTREGAAGYDNVSGGIGFVCNNAHADVGLGSNAVLQWYWPSDNGVKSMLSRSFGAVDSTQVGYFSHLMGWSGTSPITSIRIQADASNTALFQAGSTIELWAAV